MIPNIKATVSIPDFQHLPADLEEACQSHNELADGCNKRQSEFIDERNRILTGDPLEVDIDDLAGIELNYKNETVFVLKERIKAHESLIKFCGLAIPVMRDAQQKASDKVQKVLKAKVAEIRATGVVEYPNNSGNEQRRLEFQARTTQDYKAAHGELTRIQSKVSKLLQMSRDSKQAIPDLKEAIHAVIKSMIRLPEGLQQFVA